MPATDLLKDPPDVWSELKRLWAQIPAGRVSTCGALAEALGNAVAARWVGQVLVDHHHGADCPCHRVVRAGGALGRHVGGGPEAQMRRLRAEGVVVRGRTVDLERFGFWEFSGPRPLEQLRHLQEQLARRVRLAGRRRLPKLAAGVDVSYPGPEQGVAAYALCEVAGGRVVWSTTIRRPVRFPYITSYLGFREVPLLLELIETVRRAGRLVEPVLVDGSGVLHPRRAGIASHLGVAARLATVGVTKTLLCGRVEWAGLGPLESRPVLMEGRAWGVAIRPTAGSRRPLFVSPGHRVELAEAEQWVRQLLHGRRLPEPLYWADRLSREASKERVSPAIHGR
ncbi:MAG TPA: hypothetical protein EYH34_05180 [Planctomycetes bacterium]|nr:hypothetical protein [Planctomycetota bacterium]